MQICHKCHKEKSLNDFFKDSSRKSGYAYVCKSCRELDMKQWKTKNIEKLKKYQLQYRKLHPEKNRKATREYYHRNKETSVLNYHLKRNYGITLVEYQNILKKQKYFSIVFLLKKMM